MSLDSLKEEEHCRCFPLPDVSSGQVFDRVWSRILVTRALKKLESDYHRLGKNRIYHALIPLLAGGAERGDLAAIAQHLGMTEGNVRVSWSRFKSAFVAHLRGEVAETVASPQEIGVELRHLLCAWVQSHESHPEPQATTL